MLFKALILIGLINANTIFSFTIMLNPAGDNKHTGRKLHDQYERGEAFQFAKQLKFELESLEPQLQVELTHNPSQTLEPLQVANLANQLNVNLFISIHFYKEHSAQPQVFLYQFQNQTFFYAPSQHELHFYPYTQAYLQNFNLTKNILGQLHTQLSNANYHNLFTIHLPTGLPFKPLVGVVSPGLGLEIGLKKNGSGSLVKPIANSLIEVIHEFK